MALKYHPEPGTLLMCDFENFRRPEMIKTRPVIVVSPKLKRCSGLCTIVAISTVEPIPAQHYHMPLDSSLLPQTAFFQRSPSWVKGDMIYRVSFDRLNLIQIGKNPVTGKRDYFTDRLDDETMKLVYGCIMTSINIGHIKHHL